MDAQLPRWLSKPGIHYLTCDELKRASRGESTMLSAALDEMGKRSATAQRLSRPITTWSGLLGCDNRLVLSIGAGPTLRGLLRVGERSLFVHRDMNGAYVQVAPTCVLDFYVHEACQRKGDGRKLFDEFLRQEKLTPDKLGYDRPSTKLLGFCARHFGLKDYTPQGNNFVLFDQFWGPSRKPADKRPGRGAPSAAAPPSATWSEPPAVANARASRSVNRLRGEVAASRGHPALRATTDASSEPAPILMGITKDVVREGDGRTYPKQGDELTMHYTGTLVKDGTQFDSSIDKGRPFHFTIGLGEVIKGWDEGVMAMSLGEKSVLTIPSDYGYGARGAGGVIPPHADLRFEVELLAIGETTPAAPSRAAPPHEPPPLPPQPAVTAYTASSRVGVPPRGAPPAELAASAPGPGAFAGQPASSTVMQMQRELLEAQGRTRKLVAAHEAAGMPISSTGMPLRPIGSAQLNSTGFHEHIGATRDRYAREVQGRMYRRPF